MTHTSIANYDPLADEDDDESFDPVAIWEANRPFEERNRMLTPVSATRAKDTRIAQLRIEIQRLEYTILNAQTLLVGRRAELTGLTNIPATSIAEPGSTFSKEIS